MISEWLKDTQERLLAPIKIWMNSNPLRWMRLVMLLILLFWLSWFFTDIQINPACFGLLIPFCYLSIWNGYLLKDVSILIIVIMINIAFWIPHSYSYLLIKSIVYVERMKLFLIIVVSILISPFIFILNSSGNLANSLYVFGELLVMVGMPFYINGKMLEALNTDEIRQQFKVDHMSKDDEKWLIRKIGVTFVLAICVMYYF